MEEKKNGSIGTAGASKRKNKSEFAKKIPYSNKLQAEKPKRIEKIRKIFL
jgi:hypothetical protein